MNRGLLFLTVILCACGNPKEFVFQKFVQDTSVHALSLDKMYPGYNNILFIGKGNTLYNITAEETVPYDYFYQPAATDAPDTSLKHVSLKVFVDTLNTVPISFSPEAPEGLSVGAYTEWTVRNKRGVAGYPVYIWNSTAQITSIPVNGSATELIQEAKDEKGSWRPIEYWTDGFAGDVPWQYILEPDYYVITGVYKYTGEFKTDLRIKLKRGGKVFYSESFRGSVNKGQFKVPQYFSKPDSFLDEE
jgi:hypothetical protein